MKYIAAYVLSTLGGNESPSVNDLKSILASVGIDTEDEQAKLVVDSLTGKSMEELIAEGKTKMASVPTGGAVASAGGAAPGGGAAADAAPAKEEEKEEEESDEDMGFGLFD